MVPPCAETAAGQLDGLHGLLWKGAASALRRKPRERRNISRPESRFNAGVFGFHETVGETLRARGELSVA